MAEAPRESERPTKPHAPAPELLETLRSAAKPTLRPSAVTLPSREELATVDDGWFALDD